MRSVTQTEPFQIVELPTVWNFIDRTQKRYGRLLVEGYVGKAGKHVKWACLCDCGNRVSVFADNLQKGNTTSCGCVHSEIASSVHSSHRMSQSPEFHCYQTMISRCTRKSSAMYHRYGARGIKVCDRWMYGEEGLKGFECFLVDMGLKPSKKHSIERENNDGNYEPGNCRWATSMEQANNTSRNVFIEYDGVRCTVSQMARKHGINPSTLRCRIYRGVAVADALLGVCR